jgi:hypothetical protein
MRTEWGGQAHLLYLPFGQALAIAVDLRSERLRHLFDFFRNCQQCQMPNLVARRANPMYDMLCMDLRKSQCHENDISLTRYHVVATVSNFPGADTHEDCAHCLFIRPP